MNKEEIIKQAFLANLDRTPWIVGEYKTQWKLLSSGALVFQGSLEALDWIYNFYFFKRPISCKFKYYVDGEEIFKEKKAYVHGGFLEKWLAVREEILSYSHKNKIPIKLITGYSQGGALAQLAYFDLLNTGIINKEFTYCVPFASPRVFFLPSKVVKERMKYMLNVIVNMDIVPKLPFVIMGFRTVGEKIVYKVKEFYCKDCVWYKKLFYRFIPNPKYHEGRYYKENILI